MKKKPFLFTAVRPILAGAVVLLLGCTCDKSKPLAPYEGSPSMYGIVIEAESFTPKVTWIGGYVSVFGVNIGTRAALDSTLLWLVHSDGNTLHYPVTYGQLPSGAEDLTLSLGGHPGTLGEDEVYTFWVLKEDAWDSVLSHPNRPICLDGTSGRSFQFLNDTVFVGPGSHVQLTHTIDVFINFRDIRVLGKLAKMTVIQTDTSNSPIIGWKIQQAGVTDSLVAVMGVVAAPSYSSDKAIWEVWSVDESSGSPVYGSINVIPSPVVVGQVLAGTQVFVEYPGRLERNTDYMIWIASKEWDGENHARSANYHAYVTFHVW